MNGRKVFTIISASIATLCAIGSVVILPTTFAAVMVLGSIVFYGIPHFWSGWQTNVVVQSFGTAELKVEEPIPIEEPEEVETEVTEPQEEEEVTEIEEVIEEKPKKKFRRVPRKGCIACGKVMSMKHNCPCGGAKGYKKGWVKC